jgi:hypothetical protein
MEDFFDRVHPALGALIFILGVWIIIYLVWSFAILDLDIMHMGIFTTVEGRLWSVIPTLVVYFIACGVIAEQQS